MPSLSFPTHIPNITLDPGQKKSGKIAQFTFWRIIKLKEIFWEIDTKEYVQKQIEYYKFFNPRVPSKDKP